MMNGSNCNKNQIMRNETTCLTPSYKNHELLELSMDSMHVIRMMNGVMLEWH